MIAGEKMFIQPCLISLMGPRLTADCAAGCPAGHD